MDYKVWLVNTKHPELVFGGPFGITQEGVLYITWDNGKSPRHIFAKGEWLRVEILDEPVETKIQEPTITDVVE